MKPAYSLQHRWAAITAWIVLLGFPRAAKAIPPYSHIVIVEYENKVGTEIIGSPDCPYITQLSQQGAWLTNFYAQQHPSEPNYLDLFSGANQGVNDDGNYDSPAWTTPNLAPSCSPGAIRLAATRRTCPRPVTPAAVGPTIPN